MQGLYLSFITAQTCSEWLEAANCLCFNCSAGFPKTTIIEVMSDSKGCQSRLRADSEDCVNPQVSALVNSYL